MTKEIQKILLDKGYILFDLKGKDLKGEKATKAQIGAMMRSFASLGYAFDSKTLATLEGFPASVLNEFYRVAYPILSEAVGASYNMKKIFYPQFPDVADIPLLERYCDAFLHYFSVAMKDIFGDADVYYPKSEGGNAVRIPFSDEVQPRLVKAAFDEEECKWGILVPYYVNTLSSPVAIPDSKKQGISDLFDYLEEGKVALSIVDRIPFKENMAYFVNLFFEKKGGIKQCLKDRFPEFSFMDTLTDCLRVYAVMSGSSPMLVKGTKFKSLPRCARRWLLTKMSNAILRHGQYHSSNEMPQRRELWLRALEKLHPGELGDDSYIAHAAYALRSGDLKSWWSVMDTYLGVASSLSVGQALVDFEEKAFTQPGKLIRILDRILRNPAIPEEMRLQMVSDMGNEGALVGVAAPALYSLRNHFLVRKANPFAKGRAFTFETPRGTKTHYEPEDDRNPIPARILDAMLENIDHAIAKATDPRTKYLDPIPQPTKVYVEGGLAAYERYALPSNERAASAGIGGAPFGSYVDIDGKKGVVRLFTHWHNLPKDSQHKTFSDDYSRCYYEYMENGRVDIDLSAQMFSEDFTYLGCLAWHSLGTQTAAGGLYFSGDITDAPNGANEFIDVRIGMLKEARPNVRYIAMLNNVFTGQAFGEIPECFCGVMLREGIGDSGEVFEPASVLSKFDLACKARQTMSAVLDLQEMRLYFIDKPAPSCGSVAANAPSAAGCLLRRAVSPRTSLADALRISDGHRIALVDDPSKADEIIGESESATIRPTDQEKIAKLLLKPLDRASGKR